MISDIVVLIINHKWVFTYSHWVCATNLQSFHCANEACSSFGLYHDVKSIVLTGQRSWGGLTLNFISKRTKGATKICWQCCCHIVDIDYVYICNWARSIVEHIGRVHKERSWIILRNKLFIQVTRRTGSILRYRYTCCNTSDLIGLHGRVNVCAKSVCCMDVKRIIGYCPCLHRFHVVFALTIVPLDCVN